MLCDSDQILQRMIMSPSSTTSIPTTTTTTKASATSNNISSSSTIAENKVLMMQKQDQLKCPRCDSANTKFCYYNNYSLSQPRHFCKACKRYWTRGGTLRNVPVGGGCRKNKRVKKIQQQNVSNGSTPIKTHTNPNPNPNPINLISTSSSEINSLFYGIANSNNTDHMNLSAAYDNINLVQPQLSSLGLGGLMINNNNPSNQSSGLVNSTNLNNFLNNGFPSFGSEAASLLVSSLKQPKSEYSMLPNEDLQQLSHNQNSLVGNISSNTDQWQSNYPFDQSMNSSASNINGTSDLYMYWNSTFGSSGWPDATNSSVAPLI